MQKLSSYNCFRMQKLFSDRKMLFSRTLEVVNGNGKHKFKAEEGPTTTSNVDCYDTVPGTFDSSGIVQNSVLVILQTLKVTNG